MSNDVTETLLLHLEFRTKSLRAIAKEIGVPFTTVADWENRRSVPRLDQAERLAKALGHTIVLMDDR